MKRTVVSMFLIGWAAAAAHADGGRPLFYANLEYVTPGNIEKSLDEVKSAFTDQINAQGVFGGSSSDSRGALGVRVGLSVPVQAVSGLSVGGSLGFINGPSAKLKVRDSDPGNEGTLNADLHNRYLRALLEATQSFALGGPFYVKLNAGAGFGQARTEQHYFGEGSWSLETSATNTSTGFTWEAGPALIMALGAADVELGFRYEQFPIAKETDETVKVKYGGLAVYGALTF